MLHVGLCDQAGAICHVYPVGQSHSTLKDVFVILVMFKCAVAQRLVLGRGSWHSQSVLFVLGREGSLSESISSDLIIHLLMFVLAKQYAMQAECSCYWINQMERAPLKHRVCPGTACNMLNSVNQ